MDRARVTLGEHLSIGGSENVLFKAVAQQLNLLAYIIDQLGGVQFSLEVICVE